MSHDVAARASAEGPSALRVQVSTATAATAIAAAAAPAARRLTVARRR